MASRRWAEPTLLCDRGPQEGRVGDLARRPGQVAGPWHPAQRRDGDRTHGRAVAGVLRHSWRRRLRAGVRHARRSTRADGPAHLSRDPSRRARCPGRVPGDVPDPGPSRRFALGAGFDRPLAASGRPACGDPDPAGRGPAADHRTRRGGLPRAVAARTRPGGGRGGRPRGARPAPRTLPRPGRALRPGGSHSRGRGQASRLPGGDGQEPAGTGARASSRAIDPPRPGAGGYVRRSRPPLPARGTRGSHHPERHAPGRLPRSPASPGA